MAIFVMNMAAKIMLTIFFLSTSIPLTDSIFFRLSCAKKKIMLYIKGIWVNSMMFDGRAEITKIAGKKDKFNKHSQREIECN